jgi:hypothetical protein
MASNFRISAHRNSDNLHLKLLGDFDGSSAWELVNAIKKDSRVKKIFIHTNSLESINPFCCDTFQKNLAGLNLQPTRVLFTGERAGYLSPDRTMCI